MLIEKQGRTGCSFGETIDPSVKTFALAFHESDFRTPIGWGWLTFFGGVRFLSLLCHFALRLLNLCLSKLEFMRLERDAFDTDQI